MRPDVKSTDQKLDQQIKSMINRLKVWSADKKWLIDQLIKSESIDQMIDQQIKSEVYIYKVRLTDKNLINRLKI